MKRLVSMLRNAENISTVVERLLVGQADANQQRRRPQPTDAEPLPANTRQLH
jgi:hypothetical protein